MGLSVISQLANAVTANPAAGPASANSPQSGDFAALLLSQPLAALLSQGSNLPIIPKALADDTTRELFASDTATDPGISQLDPAALIALLGIAQNQPTTRGETPGIELTDDTPVVTSAGQLLAVNIPAESKTRDLPPMSDKALAAQRTSLGIPGTAPPLPNDPASATKPLPDTANIAAGNEPGMNQAPTFSQTIATSLDQRSIAPGSQSNTNSIAAHLHNPAWSQQFSEKVVWMANREIQSAQININPPQLGPVQITLNLSGDQATAVFASPHAEVRQAIESSMPQLKEMLASAGISLGDTNVGANLAQQNQNSPFPTPNRTQATLENAILPANDNAPGVGVATPLQQGRGLVDLFA